MLRALLFLMLPVALFAQSAAEVVFGAEAQALVAGDALKAYYAIEGDFTVTPVGLTLAPMADAPDKVEVLEAPEKPQATMIIKIRFLKGGVAIGTLAGTFHAQWQVPAFVSVRTLQRKAVPTSDDFEIRNVDRLSSRAVPVETTLMLADYEMLSTLQAGATLTWNSLRPKPLVRKGDVVDVVAQEGAMKISSKAVAMQEGGRHQQIIVRNTTTNRQFQAEVINENLVTVRF